ncbi:MAG: hypothetical protein ACK4NS_01805 [Saprospiraceae bacterium]
MKTAILWVSLAFSPLFLAAQQDAGRVVALPQPSALLDESLLLLRKAQADNDVAAVNYHYTRWFETCRALITQTPQATQDAFWQLAASLEGFAFDSTNPNGDANALDTLERLTRLLAEAVGRR